MSMSMMVLTLATTIKGDSQACAKVLSCWKSNTNVTLRLFMFGIVRSSVRPLLEVRTLEIINGIFMRTKTESTTTKQSVVVHDR